jgi:type VI protein secretion system component Hcp
MATQPLTYLLKIDGVTGDSTIDGYQGYFTVDEFTFNELTRLANGGGGAVTGKAQFDPLMVDISGMSPGLVTLLKYAATGKHIPSVELVGLQSAGEGQLQKVCDLTLNNVTVAGYAADGGHETALAFDYTRLTDTIKGQNPDGSLNAGQTFAANVTNGNTPVDHNALAALAHSQEGPALTYLIRIDGATGDSTIDGYQGYFTVDEFTFNELTRLANGSGGAGAGKAQFDPLMVDIAGLPPGLVTVLKDAANGKHIASVELVGLKPAGEGPLQKVYDLTLNNVTVAGYAADGGHDTALAFDYTRLTETIKGQNPDGSLNAGQTFATNVSNGNTAVDHNALAALAHSNEGPALTYLIRIDGATGDSTIDGYQGYFTVDEFTFNELTRLANGGGGARTGKAQYDPLMVDIAGLSPGLATLLKDAATGKHIPSVELVGLQSGGDGPLQKVYDLTLNNVTVAGYAADSGHDTAVAFDYTRLTETIKGQNPDGSLNAGQTFATNVSNGNTAVDHAALAALAHSHEGPALTYLIKIDGATGDSTIEGYQGYFTVDEFTFNELSTLTSGGGGGAATGKAKFDPLMVDLAGLSPRLVTVLKDAATGKHIPSVELVGLQSGGDGPLQKVYDLTLNNVTVAGYAADGGHDTALAFDYTRLTETIKGQNPDGSINAGQTVAVNLASGGSINPVDHNALAAFAHSHEGPELTYLLRVDGATGDSTVDGYQGYFTVDEFTFNELTRLANGSGGAGAGEAQFDPLTVDIAGLSPGVVTLLKDAATGKHISSVELVGLQSGGDGPPQKVYDLTLNNVTATGYAADGGHDTAVAFDYTRLTETIKGQNPDGSLNAGQTVAVNITNGNTPVDHNALAAFAHSHDSPALTYLLRVDGATGDSTIDGYQGDFRVDEFTFNELARLANSGAGAATGKAQFDPLMVDIAGLSPGVVTLLKDAATGKHIPSVELVGLQSTGEGQLQKVYDLTLNNVTVAGYAADGGHDTALAFDYTAVTETIKGYNPDGSLNPGQTVAFNVSNGNTPVDHNALAAFAHAHDGFFLA